ncbi:MAG: ATP synthase F1 subunit gamma [Bacteroidota bacterium]
MANLKEIKSRIKTVKNTRQVTNAMKMVAAAKLRKAQDRMLQLRPYASKLKEIIGNVMSAVDQEEIPSRLVEQREVDNVLVIIVTSNRGLAGPFNSNIIKHANAFIHEHYPGKREEGKLHMLCIGRRGYDYYNKRGYSLIGENHDVFTKLSFDLVNEVADRVFEGFLAGEFDKVHLVFNEFKNVMSQNRIAEDLLPLAVSSLETETEEEGGINMDYIFEPDREQILTDLIPRALRIQLFRAVLESNASEQGARMVAMDKATENAEELLKGLKISFNKARQASITTEILEISAGADALAAQ